MSGSIGSNLESAWMLRTDLRLSVGHGIALGIRRDHSEMTSLAITTCRVGGDGALAGFFAKTEG
jgi:hypothetical protein